MGRAAERRGSCHAGTQRPSIRLVDQDESPGRAVFAIRVDGQRRGQHQPYPTDVVKSQGIHGRPPGTSPTSKSRSSAPSMAFTIALVRGSVMHEHASADVKITFG